MSEHKMAFDLRAVCGHFALEGTYVEAAPYGSGHINDTFAAVYDRGDARVRYIIQRINHNVFKNPAAVMANVDRVTRHQRAKLEAAGVEDLARRALTLLPTVDGAAAYTDPDGNWWRAYVFIEGARTYDQIETAAQAREAAKAFGAFQGMLADLPPPRLVETIPGFHDTRSRYDALQRAMAEDVCNRAASVKAEIAFAASREGIVDTLLDLHRAGDLPERITHNDTKLNNVMIDDATTEGICVIDLDTVMPGLSLYDFGDMVRTATRPTPEDERDLAKVAMQMDMYEALLDGYLASAGAFLNRAEKDNLAFSARLITFEIGLRFLTDYLQGDVYFKTHRDGHNLDRCRVQFTMVESFERNADAMARLAAGR